MANRTKLQVCNVVQPAHQVPTGEKQAVCDKRPGHKDAHRRRGLRARVIYEVYQDQVTVSVVAIDKHTYR